MSIEFRLKYIRDAIDKNVNECLLKWNARKVLLNEPFDEERKELCPACMNTGTERFLKYCYVNLDEAIYKCESTTCLYPFRNFKYKSFADRTIFRYERIGMDTSENKTEQKIFTSPTKVETDAIDEFNISWLGDDLDSILSAPSEGQTCDMKDIINNLCSDVDTIAPAIFNSPVRNESGYSTQSTAPKLSKCLQYIEHISPTKQTSSSTFKSRTPAPRTLTSMKSTAISHETPSLKPGFKSFKKVPTGKHRRSRPVQSIVEQQPLGFLEWLNVVSKTEPKQIQELEFASVNECKEPRDPNTTISDRSDLVADNAQTSSESNNVQSILIELMSTPDSLGSDRLPNNTKPCLLYKWDHSELEPTNDQSEAIPNCHQPVTAQTLENLPSPVHIDIGSAEANVERSSSVNGESLSDDIEIIETELGTGSNLRGQDNTATNDVHMKPAEIKRQGEYKSKVEKEKLKLGRKEKVKLEHDKRRKTQQQERRKLTFEAQLQERRDQVKGFYNRKKFNIEVEENFAGFEAVEPFGPITLRKRELVWLTPE